MRYTCLLRVPVLLTVLAGLPPLRPQAPPPPPPSPTCAGCGAQSQGGSISHRRGCPYGGAEEPDEPAPRPTTRPGPPVPPPESKFDRDKKDLINRLTNGAPATTTFDGGKRDLLNRMQSGLGSGSGFAGEKAGLQARLAQGSTFDDPAIAAAAGELALKSPATVANLKETIQARCAAPNTDVRAVIRSLKFKSPPPLSTRFDNLRVGDVLLVRQPDNLLSVDFYTSGWIILVDKVMTASLRPRASHTFLFAKEVNGVKLFLDNMPGQGTRVKTEAQILAEFGTRNFDVAQPVGKLDTDALWKAARETGLRSLQAFAKRSRNLIDTTDYGAFGDEDLVCSETSRWALMKAGMAIPETRSALKEKLGIAFGPADFYVDTDHFLVTPLSLLKPRPKPAR